MAKCAQDKQDLDKARAIARALAVDQDVDRNELGKVNVYLRRQRGRKDGRQHFLTLLQRLAGSPYVRSGRTADYFSAIQRTLAEQLADVRSDERALRIVNWAFRLMAYEKAKAARGQGRVRTRT